MVVGAAGGRALSASDGFRALCGRTGAGAFVEIHQRFAQSKLNSAPGIAPLREEVEASTRRATQPCDRIRLFDA